MGAATLAAYMPIHRIAYAATKRFSTLVLDHVADDSFLSSFRDHAPTWDGLKAAAGSRQFNPAHRPVLVAAIKRQYAGIELGDAVSSSIEKLARPDALTITTGHQLCVFLGPLYVPFKLLNTIRLAREAEAKFGVPVVPVFWMASEDHDRAEIDHAWLGDRRLHWPGATGGAVGRMPLEGIDQVVNEACAALGQGTDSARLQALLRECYRADRTLAEATRRFAHALFGRFGLVILDGDDRFLKQLFAPIMREELLNGITQRAVQYADEQLAPRYAPQAHARAINLFHLRDGHRARIEADGDHYQVMHGGPRFTPQELLLDLEVRPQDYSPNVLLRPLYQESILPNIAYIGGGGELAYWMQLKWLFQAVRVPMPVVLLRTSAALLSAKSDRQREALSIGIEELFEPPHELRTRLARSLNGQAALLTDEAARLQDLMRSARTKASAVDGSLAASSEAASARMQRQLDGLQERIDRALRRKETVALDRLDKILSAVFPGDGLQERRLNFLPLLAERGEPLLDAWMEALDPLDPRFTVLVDP